jgi:hypothetical protein
VRSCQDHQPATRPLQCCGWRRSPRLGRHGLGISRITSVPRFWVVRSSAYKARTTELGTTASSESNRTSSNRPKVTVDWGLVARRENYDSPRRPSPPTASPKPTSPWPAKAYAHTAATPESHWLWLKEHPQERAKAALMRGGCIVLTECGDAAEANGMGGQMLRRRAGTLRH